MANGIADMLVQSTIQSGQNAGNDIQQGAQLGQHIEQIQQNRAALELKKQEAQMAKIEKLGQMFDTASKMPAGKSKNTFLNKFIPSARDAMGLTDLIPDTSMEMLQGDPTLVPYLKSWVASGAGSVQDLVRGIKDPEWLSQHYADPQFRAFVAQKEFGSQVEEALPELQKSEEMRISAGYKAKNAATMSGRATDRQDRTLLAGLADDFDKAVSKDKEKLGAAIGVKALLNSNSPVASEAAKRQIARLSGEVGVLTDADVIAWGGSKAWLDRAKQFLNTAAEGELTPENKKNLIEIATQFQGIVTNKIKLEAERAYNKGGALELDPAKVREVVSVDNILKNAEKAAASGGNSNWQKIVSKQAARVKALKPELQKQYIEESARKYNIDPAEVKKALGL